MNLKKRITQFLEFCTVERGLSRNTLQAYSYDLADFHNCLPSRTESADIKTEHLREYLEHMVEQRKLSNGTVRRRVACLRSFFRYCDEIGVLTDPFVGWRLKLPRRKRLPRALSREETLTLLASARRVRTTPRVKHSGPPLTEISLMIATGIRVGELCKIQTSDVSHDGSTLRIHGKGSRDRIVYVTDSGLRSELRMLVAGRLRSSRAHGPLFLNRNGNQLRPHSFRSKLRISAGSAGLQHRVTPHMLRHTAATLLIESGVDIRIVQRLLGHSSIATTEIYTHVSDEALRSTLQRANILGALVA
ncbi:MAG: integrase/recombinase XerD [Bradyrhizobium sp.]|nr:integrase/recombinase XerD [Bradyrhizobium sp.]